MTILSTIKNEKRKPIATKWKDRIAKSHAVCESIQSKIGFICFPRETKLFGSPR